MVNTQIIKSLHNTANLYNTPPQPSKPLNPNSSSKPLNPVEKRRKENVDRWMTSLVTLPGRGYLTGTIIGFTKGSFQAVKAGEPVLHSGVEMGKRFGGSWGVIGIVYTGFEFGIAKWRGSGGLANTAAAGFCTGALYRLFSGKPKGVRFAGVVGAVAAITWKSVVMRNGVKVGIKEVPEELSYIVPISLFKEQRKDCNCNSYFWYCCNSAFRGEDCTFSVQDSSTDIFYFVV